jgi:hypothetical protein
MRSAISCAVPVCVPNSTSREPLMVDLWRIHHSKLHEGLTHPKMRQAATTKSRTSQVHGKAFKVQSSCMCLCKIRKRVLGMV